MNANLSEVDIEQFLRDTFEDNYRTLRLEGGHGLTPDIKDYAYQQVLRYWQKLKQVAENVTDTEVPLVLPNQQTPKKRHYNIEGVVDILREGSRTVMYDIKTHDGDYVRENRELYEKQLNVYAHIWQELRGQPLDETAASFRVPLGTGDERGRGGAPEFSSRRAPAERSSGKRDGPAPDALHR